MIKKSIVFLLFILLFPSVVLAKDTCNDNDIIIKSITVKDTNGFSEELNESSISNNKINLDLKMYDVGDSIEYDLLIKNNSNKDYYFTSDSLKIDNDYLEYSLLNESEKKSVDLYFSQKENKKELAKVLNKSKKLKNE